MRRWLSIVLLGLGLMASWAPNAAATTWILFQGVWIKIGSLEVTSDWFAKNLDVRPATYAVTISPISAIVHFANPGGNLGGDASANFGTDVEITLSGTVNPALSGKHDIQDTLIFGDCDDCAAAGVNLPQDGALWLMFMNAAGCNSNQGYLEKINCVKDWLKATYEPNTKWRPVSVLVQTFDLFLRGWQDYNKDGSLEETVYAQYFNYTISNDGASYTSTDPNNCVWQYNYPKSLSGACSNNSGCCDPYWGVCNPFNEQCVVIW